MRRHKANAFQSFDLFNSFKKLGKCNRMFQILTIRIDILAEQHNLNNTICNKLADFGYDRLRITASFSSTYIWYDTVTAEVITSKHDIYSGFEGEFTVIRKVFNNFIGIFPDIDHHTLRFETCDDEFGKFKNIMRSKNNIYIAITRL